MFIPLGISNGLYFFVHSSTTKIPIAVFHVILNTLESTLFRRLIAAADFTGAACPRPKVIVLRAILISDYNLWCRCLFLSFLPDALVVMLASTIISLD
jgi:hypothetical protein